MFQNILVGVDLARCNPLETSGLGLIAQDVIERSIWLAQRFQARLSFFASFNMGEDSLHALAVDDRNHLMLTLEEKAVRVLDELVARAGKQGVEASRVFALGKAWEEIIRQALRGKHDLAIVGTRNLTGFRRMLFGNTAMKLLRRCPCPVWVVKPGMKTQPFNILVATNLKAVALGKLALAVQLAKRLTATLHILHVVEYPLDRLAFVNLEAESTDRYHQKVCDDARHDLQAILEQTDYRDLGSRCQIHIEDGVGVPDVAIQHDVEANQIDLLIMGTIGRSGLSGVFIGNTAERLLPELQCSVLAVKPPEFQCPIQLDDK